MGFKPNWQQESYAKTSSTPKVSQKGNIVRNELFHNAQSRIGLADGGDVTEAQLKAEGIAASKNDGGSLWDRLKAGNIDDPKSDAYNKYGAGRGKMERDMARDNSTKLDFDSSSYTGRNEKTAPKMEMAAEPEKPKGVFSNVDAAVKSATSKPMPEAREESMAAKPAPRKAKPVAAPDESAAETRRLRNAENSFKPSKPYPVDSKENDARPSKPMPKPAVAESPVAEKSPVKESTITLPVPKADRNSKGGVTNLRVEGEKFRTSLGSVPWENPKQGKSIESWAAAIRSGRSESKPEQKGFKTRAEQMKKMRSNQDK